MSMTKKTWRQWHFFFTFFTILPLGIVAITGTILIFRANIPGLQAKATKSSSSVVQDHNLTLNQVITLSGLSADQIDRITYVPSKGLLTVRAADQNEIILDAANGQVLGKGKRHISWLIDLHEGKFFGKLIQYLVYVPNGIALFALYLTGLYGLSVILRNKFRRRI
jgi:uncharacterized iron-regulated membrane protein